MPKFTSNLKIAGFLSAMLLICTLFAAHNTFASESDYVIGAEDVLDISVWQSPDLTKTVTVDASGTIDYPFLGKIQAVDRTPLDIQTEIARKLSEGYLNEPKVSVTVKEFNSKKILVFGQVVSPGLYKIKTKTALLELLFMVGGTKDDAKRMTVIRPLNDSSGATPTALMPESFAEVSRTETTVYEIDLLQLLQKGDLSQNILIYPGDTIYVSSGTGQKYYVLGQVNNPGPYEWTGEITVLEAIKLADGPTDLAALNRIKVRKKINGREQVVKVNMVDIMKGTKKDDVIIEPESVIIVPRSWI